MVVRLEENVPHCMGPGYTRAEKGKVDRSNDALIFPKSVKTSLGLLSEW
jgi:hypothetical protein